jgi:hypothetical protein
MGGSKVVINNVIDGPAIVEAVGSTDGSPMDEDPAKMEDAEEDHKNRLAVANETFAGNGSLVAEDPVLAWQRLTANARAMRQDKAKVLRGALAGFVADGTQAEKVHFDTAAEAFNEAHATSEKVGQRNRFARMVAGSAEAAIKLSLIADALAMPTHWFTNPPHDITHEISPAGIQWYEPAPATHTREYLTTAWMNQDRLAIQSVVGPALLKGREDTWLNNKTSSHNGLAAGTNTLEGHLVRVVMRAVASAAGNTASAKGKTVPAPLPYTQTTYRDAYVNFMKSGESNDPHLETSHQAFFYNLLHAQLPAAECASAITPWHQQVRWAHNSLHLLAPVGASVFQALPSGAAEAIQAAKEHVAAVAESPRLAATAGVYAALLIRILTEVTGSGRGAVSVAARIAILKLELEATAFAVGVDLKEMLLWSRLAGAADITAAHKFGMYNPWLADGFPFTLFLAYKYVAATPLGGHFVTHGLQSRVRSAVLTNANLGGDSTSRGLVLGTIIGVALGPDAVPSEYTEGLEAHAAIAEEVKTFSTYIDTNLGGGGEDHTDL